MVESTEVANVAALARVNYMNSFNIFIQTLWLTEGARPNRDSGERFIGLAHYVKRY